MRTMRPVSAHRAGSSSCGAVVAAYQHAGWWRRLMRRVMSLWLPSWAIDRRRLVMAVEATAQERGIAPGMTLSHAHALHPGLAVASADPAGDRAALARLAAACRR